MTDKRFGKRIRAVREKRLKDDPQYSLRRFAKMVGMSPTYLSRVERGDIPPPAEEKVVAIAHMLDIDPDELLALAGKVASDLSEIIRQRPSLIARSIRKISTLEDEQVKKIFRLVEDGKW